MSASAPPARPPARLQPTEAASPSPDREPTVRPQFRRRWWRRHPGVAASVGVLLVLLLVALLTLVASDSSQGNDLDPRSAGPTGTLALAQLLRARGIDTTRGAAAGPGETFVVPFAGQLEPDELSRILDGSRDAARVVLLVPDGVPEAQLTPTGAQTTSTRAPSCSLAAAVVAGAAELGGRTYLGPGISCYAGSLLAGVRGTTPLVALGSSTLLTNARLDRQGNAALALGVMSGEGMPGTPSRTVVWYQPALDPQAATPSLRRLLPPGLLWGILQLLIAAALVALWRARRLGPVVEEPLPVVVPAAETVEGRARLYAAGRARGAAAAALRAGARDRLAGRLQRGAEPDPAGLVAAIAARSGRSPGEIAQLLYGSAGPAGNAAPTAAATEPADDAALVRLADEIDRLEREVRAR